MSKKVQITEKVERWLDETGYSKRQVAIEAGLPVSSLTTALQRKSMSIDMFEKIQQHYPELAVEQVENKEQSESEFYRQQITNLQTIIKQQEYVINVLKEIIEKNGKDDRTGEKNNHPPKESD